jgi:glucose/arabinose dehydrogenase
MRRRTRGSLLDLAAKVAGAVALVVVLVVVKPFAGPGKPHTGSNLATYASGLVAPTYVTAAPGEPKRLYVVEQGRQDQVSRRPPDRGNVPRHQVARRERRRARTAVRRVQPTLRTRPSLLVDYTDRNGDTRVVEFRSPGGHALLDSARLLLYVKQPYPNHNGGQLQFGPDRLLYVGMGDGGGGGDPQNRAQNLHDPLGKLLRTVPHARAAHWQTVGYGLRNPWRFSFDRATGDLYIGDVGQSAWEELDFRPRAKLAVLTNYGWRVFEGRARFAPGSPSAADALVAPITVYSHKDGCSITGGYVYRGRTVPASVGRYFFGDFCSGHVFSLRVEDGRATGLHKESARIGQLSSFG